MAKIDAVELLLPNGSWTGTRVMEMVRGLSVRNPIRL